MPAPQYDGDGPHWFVAALPYIIALIATIVAGITSST